MTQLRKFVCGLCGEESYADPALDDECRAEFIRRYGHTPEETVDDEIVSLCNACNAEYERLRKNNEALHR